MCPCEFEITSDHLTLAEHTIYSLGCLFVFQQLNKSLQLLYIAKRERHRRRQREMKMMRESTPRSWSAPKLQHEPFSCTSWASCRARGRVYVPPSLPLPPRGENHYQIQSPSARGAMAAAAAAVDCVYDAEHESGTTWGETDTARARYLNAQSSPRSAYE